MNISDFTYFYQIAVKSLARHYIPLLTYLYDKCISPTRSKKEIDIFISGIQKIMAEIKDKKPCNSIKSNRSINHKKNTEWGGEERRAPIQDAAPKGRRQEQEPSSSPSLGS